MQGSLLGIGLMAAVVVIGSIVGFRRSATRAQMQATFGAFASLAVLVVLFCGIVVVMSQMWALPLFACASVAVPIAT